MEPNLEALRRANIELQAWVRDLLDENRGLRDRLVEMETAEAMRACPTVGDRSAPFRYSASA